MSQVVPLPTAQTRLDRLWRMFLRAQGAYEFDPCEETLSAKLAAVDEWRAEFLKGNRRA